MNVRDCRGTVRTGALAFVLLGAGGEPDLAPATATIRADEVRAHVAYLASESLEGRDSPSLGLELASRYLCERFAAAGLAPASDAAEAWSRHASGEAPPDWSRPPSAATQETSASAATYLRPFTVEQVDRRAYRAPVPEDCSLELLVDGVTTTFEYGRDFVPVLGMEGDVRGELAFAGFGIDCEEEHYDDFDGMRLKGKLALILEGEPRHSKRFEGEEVTDAASMWRKVARLAEEGVAGIVVARRPPPKKPGGKDSAAATEPAPLAFRYTWAFFMGQRPDAPAKDAVPMIEVSAACAKALLGEDVEALAQKIDRAARPVKHKSEGRTVSFRTRLEDRAVRMDNVVGVVPGTDPLLASQWVIVGAHYDHIGVGPRGLVGYGADDNGSGTAALIEIVEAMAAAPARRSVLFAAFAAEEDGLVGSQRLAQELPFSKEAVVAMVNLDMIGRGEDDVAMVLGIQYNPDLERVLDRAKKLGKTGIKTIEQNGDRELFQRSDQYSFHQIGIPTVFFMEDLPLAVNTEYHTWKDVVDLVDMDKVANTSKLAFHTAWILATDDGRPSAPRE